MAASKDEVQKIVEEVVKVQMVQMKKELLSDIRDIISAPPAQEPTQRRSPRQEEAVAQAGNSQGYQPLVEDPEARLLTAEAVKYKPTWAQIVVRSAFFEFFTVSLVLLNAIWIGVQTQHAALYWTADVPLWFDMVDRVFCVCFVLECALKMLSDRSDYFCDFPHAGWNWFDLFATSTQVLEVVLSFGSSQFSQAMRILRMLRLARIARIAAVFPDLRKLVTSVTTSLVPLGWTLLLIFLLNYAFSIMVTQVVTDHKISAGREVMEEQEELLEFFGSLDTTFLSLYMVISEGIHWCELVKPLAENISPYTKPIACLFVAFQLFAMMNVITAYFVESAFKAAAASEREEMAHELFQVFESEDGQQSGSSKKKRRLIITEADFQKNANHPKMAEFIDLLGVDPEEASHLWELVDTEGAGKLDAEHFVNGCMKLVGNARAEMIWRLAFENRQRHKETVRKHQELLRAVQSIAKK